MHERIYIGIGSNLGQRHATIHAGVRSLNAHAAIEVVRLSSIIETDPVGPAGQGPYLNAACEVRTSFGPRELLDAMLEIERVHGRDRSKEQRWGARTLDLDLLLFRDVVIDEDGLTVPHPRMHERSFVMIPLRELRSHLASIRG
ncbi:MAG: 2-amino-4-hydroxy-6-hydroxymethyldihydropteridine diphosphokinase [Phycisphaerales bacterium]